MKSLFTNILVFLLINSLTGIAQSHNTSFSTSIIVCNYLHAEANARERSLDGIYLIEPKVFAFKKFDVQAFISGNRKKSPTFSSISDLSLGSQINSFIKIINDNSCICYSLRERGNSNTYFKNNSNMSFDDESWSLENRKIFSD